MFASKFPWDIPGAILNAIIGVPLLIGLPKVGIFVGPERVDEE